VKRNRNFHWPLAKPHDIYKRDILRTQFIKEKKSDGKGWTFQSHFLVIMISWFSNNNK